MKAIQQALTFVLRLALICLAMGLAYMLSTMLIPQGEMNLTPEEMRWSGVALLIVSALNALVLVYPVLRSQWRGLKLVAALWLLQFGVETFITHMETLYFNQAVQMQTQELLALVGAGALRALIFAPLAVLILGKWKANQAQPIPEAVRHTWLRLAGLSVLYVLVYFMFGYYVAWQWQETRQFYSGSTAILPFWQHFRGLFSSDPWIIPFQLLRGALWSGFALLTARMMTVARRWEAALATAMVFAGLLCVGLVLFPNPYMPDTVRMSHFYEILSSMLLFGAAAGWAMHPPTLQKGQASRSFRSLLRRRGSASALGVLLLVLCAACTPKTQRSKAIADLPNPASAYCEQQGNQLEIRTAADGSQSGVCIFPDGSECDEWAYYRDECRPQPALEDTATPGGQEIANDGCKVYRNADLGYSFHYPADARLETNDDPLGSLSVVGALRDGEAWPSYMLSHPAEREEFHPPQGVELAQWLEEHYLLGDERLVDMQIAGTTAVHLRHDRSPQSYAYDRYYFAHAGQLYMIVIGHTGDREDWDLYNHFLDSFKFEN